MFGLALASAGAGVIHLSATTAHREHAPIFAFFAGVALVQIAWAVALLMRRPARAMIIAGAIFNAVIVAVWLASRVTGLPFVEGAGHAEPVGIKDAVASMLEVAVVVGALMWMRSRSSFAPRNVNAPLAAATAVLISVGVVAPAHHHPSEHTHSSVAAHGGHKHAAHDRGQHSHDAGAHDAAAHDAGSHSRHRGGHTGDAHIAGHPSSEEAHGGHTPTRTHGHDAADAHRSSQHGHADAPPAAGMPPPAAKGLSKSVRYGPFMLPPADLGGNAHYNRILTNVAKPCANCYLTALRPNLVYADGSPANLDTGPMLHHAVWSRPNIADPTCNRSSATGSQGMRFFASGNERTRMSLPAGFGYRVGADPWNLILEVMNHSNRARTVYLELSVTYLPGDANVRGVTPVWLDIDNCRDSQYAVPAGRSEARWTWPSTITGRIVAAGGHVHDGGVKVVLRNETGGREVCSSVAGYGKDPRFAGSVESMSTCVWDKIGTVRRGQTLGIRAFYNSSEAQSDVMGIVLAYIYETDDLAGGTTPPTSDRPRDPDPPPVHEH